MKNTLLSNLIIISTAVILSACGGGGDSGSSSSTPAPTYGTISVNVANQGGSYVGYNGSYMVSNRTSQVSSDADAVSGCKTVAATTNCIIALQFGQNQCGSIARSYVTNTGVYGTGSGASGSIAEANAISACQKNGGSNCIVPTCVSGTGTCTGGKLTLCNGTGSATAITTTESGGTNNSSSVDIKNLSVAPDQIGEALDENNPGTSRFVQ